MQHTHGLLFDLDGVVYCAKCGDALPGLGVLRNGYGDVKYIPKSRMPALPAGIGYVDHITFTSLP